MYNFFVKKPTDLYSFITLLVFLSSYEKSDEGESAVHVKEPQEAMQPLQHEENAATDRKEIPHVVVTVEEKPVNRCPLAEELKRFTKPGK